MAHPPRSIRFLVVEDEALLAMDISIMIEDAGHVVVGEAGCLREVQELPGAIRPQVALVDIHLAEGSNGLDVCAHIRSHWKDAIIVFVTANPKKLPNDYAGGHAVLFKPFSRTSLMAMVRFISEGISDPPPSCLPPADFQVSDSLFRTCAT